MSAFLAFRRAAVSVLRPQTTHRLTQDLPATSPLFQASIRGMTKRSHPKNGQIPYDIVQVIDTEGTLHHPQKLARILASINPTTHLVRLINHNPPQVRILTQVEDKARKLAEKAEKKVLKGPGRIETKETQLTWFTADTDFHHKIAKAKDDLEKGDVRLDVVFKSKPGVRYPSREEMNQHIQQIVDILADVATEWRERDIRRGNAKISFQSLVHKSRKALPTREEIEAEAKEATKHLEKVAAHQKRGEEEREKINSSLKDKGLDVL